MGRTVVHLAVVAALIALASHAFGQDVCIATEFAKLTADDAASLDVFGRSVSIDDDVAVIGAPDEGTAGAIYVFRRDGYAWTQEAKLTPSEGDAGDGFGLSVAIAGDVLVAGAPSDDDGGINAGAAYTYRFENGEWSFEQKLLPFDGDVLDGFGSAVAADRDRILVGAPFDDEQGLDAGAAYVFRFVEIVWVQEPKLTPPTAQAGDLFGAAVDLDGNFALIGAPGDNVIGQDSGSAHAFEHTGNSWVYENLFTPPVSASDQVGSSVTLAGGLAVLGAPTADVAGPNSGACWAYARVDDQWTLEGALTGTSTSEGDQFGTAVSAGADLLVVGARFDTLSVRDSGSATVFRRGDEQWIEIAALTATDAQINAELGRALATDGTWLVVGAWHDNEFGLNSGSAYCVANFDDCDGSGTPDACEAGPTIDCNVNGQLDLCDLFKGVSADANCNGIPDECDQFADLNGDGEVDLDDMLVILENWGPCPVGECCLGDLNGDGAVNGTDLGLLLSRWSQLGEAPSS